MCEWCYTLITQVEQAKLVAQQLCEHSLKCMSATVSTILLCVALWGNSVIFLSTKIHLSLCGTKTMLTLECVLYKSLSSSANISHTAQDGSNVKLRI